MLELTDVKQFITDNVSPDALNAALVETVRSKVFAKLRTVYDVSDWTTKQTTPNLVVSIMAMLYAGKFYNKEYSGQDVGENSYGTWLINQAELLLMQLVSGELALSEDFPIVTNNRDLINESVPAFTMGDVF